MRADPSFHCNARNSLLAGGGAECHANKIPRSGCWATEEGAAQPVAKGGAGALQERELGAVGLRQDVRASVFTENCKVQVAQRTAGRRNTLQVGAGRAGKAGSRIRWKGATGGLEAGWQAGRHQQLAAEHKAGVGQVKVAPHGLAGSPLKGCGESGTGVRPRDQSGVNMPQSAMRTFLQICTVLAFGLSEQHFNQLISKEFHA